MPIKEFETLWYEQQKVIKALEESPGESHDQIYVSGRLLSATERVDCKPRGRENLKDATVVLLGEMLCV